MASTETPRREIAEAFVEKWPIFASPVDAVELLLRARDERAAKIAENYETGFIYPSNDAGLIAAARINIAAEIRGETKQGDPVMPQTLKSGTTRRSRIDLLTPAEAAIRIAQIAVEEMVAHPALTEAANLLQQARDKVADYVDEEIGIH